MCVCVLCVGRLCCLVCACACLFRVFCLFASVVVCLCVFVFFCVRKGGEGRGARLVRFRAASFRFVTYCHVNPAEVELGDGKE